MYTDDLVGGSRLWRLGLDVAKLGVGGWRGVALVRLGLTGDVGFGRAAASVGGRL